ncbi:MAG: efflux RND transporter periplasmic adaptor subunit [Prolixibacteraceae bacterium]
MSRIVIISLIVWSLTACQNTQPTVNNKDQEHSHEDVKIQYTAYSNEFEVFAEADPFSTGHPAELLAHFTKLKDFSAVENCSITASLIIGNQKHSQTLEQATRRGIFKFELNPEIAGKGQLIFTVSTDTGNFVVQVPDVQVFADEHDAIHAAEDAETTVSNGVVFTKEQSWKIDFATEMPSVESFGQVIKTSGIVQNSPDSEEIVTARTSGIVNFTSGNILSGNPVSAGQNLLTISGDQMAENNSSVRFTEARNNFEKGKADFDRLTELYKDRIVSEKDLLDSKNKFENAQAVFLNLKSNFSQKGQAVKPSVSGFVSQVFVSNGQFVNAGQAILSVAKNQTLLIQADVQQKYAVALTSLQSAIIREPNSGKRFTLEELNGKIQAIGRSANNNNYMIPVSLQIKNSGVFIPGSFVEIFLKTNSGTNSLTVPNTAIMEEQGNFFVFVQITPELFEKCMVQTGATDGVRTVIKSGILPAKRIVSKGAVLVKLAQTSGALDAHSGHVH